jgi:serine/threonine protein kinase
VRGRRWIRQTALATSSSSPAGGTASGRRARAAPGSAGRAPRFLDAARCARPRRVAHAGRAHHRVDHARRRPRSAVRTSRAALRLLVQRTSSCPPALAERVDDIPVLVDHFLRRHARQLGKVVDGVSPESMRRLETYSWPGNVRELRTVLERAVLVSRARSRRRRGAVRTGDHGRQLPPGGAARAGRHGRGVARQAPAARPASRREAHSPGRARRHRRRTVVRRFQREAQVTANLRSPHTVQLYDFGVNETAAASTT